MSNRITQSDLGYLVDRINTVTESPAEPYDMSKEVGSRTNINNYHLDYAYGGVKLVQMANSGGGIRVISTGGYGTKRELHQWLQAYLVGLEN